AHELAGLVVDDGGDRHHVHVHLEAEGGAGRGGGRGRGRGRRAGRLGEQRRRAGQHSEGGAGGSGRGAGARGAGAERRAIRRTTRKATTRRVVAASSGTTTVRTNIPTASTSSKTLIRGLARPPVKVVEAARRTVLAAWGTAAEGAPTATPRARAVSGSRTSHITEAARRVPAAGRRTVESMSSAWSTAGTLSPITSITEIGR